MKIKLGTLLFIAGAAGLTPADARAQFDPGAAHWGKMDPAHVRVMTWNVEDAVCSTNFKIDSAVSWNALVRTVATLRPDILILQETADNDGNGTGGSLDSVAALETTIDLFFEGGFDPFRGEQVTSYVQKFSEDPAYDLPHVFVSNRSDFGINNGFNRNVILSRWPFADINGDGIARYHDIPLVVSDYAVGTGGIRGFQFAEIDLPDDLYGGDLVIGNGHLKSGGGASNENQRVGAGKNVGYFIDHFYNGAGTEMVDPESSISDNPQPTRILDDLTPVIVGGDWNQDEAAALANPSNLKGPAAWITEGPIDGPDDGSDRDRTDMTRDAAPRKVISFNGTVFDGSPLTHSVGKIDYIAYQDSIVTMANQFVFDTFELNGVFPPPIASYPGQGFNVSTDAADHWPVIVDFVFPEPAPRCPADLIGGSARGRGEVGASDLGALIAAWGSPAGDPAADLDGDGSVGPTDLGILIASWGPCE